MNLKQKFKNYGFWMSLTAAVILVLQTIGKNFGFSVNDEAITSVVNSILGILILLGIISNPTSGKGYIDKEQK
jgi:phi LC3 family holin